MSPSELKKVISQSTAALDQYWEAFEIMYPFVCDLSRGIPDGLSTDYRETARLCCQLVAWELALRSLKKNRTCKCEVRYKENGSAIVEILTSEGYNTFVVPTHSVLEDDDGVRVMVTTFKAPDGYHKTFLSTHSGEVAKEVLIPEEEIEQGLPDVID
jgi:hypothetical protein